MHCRTKRDWTATVGLLLDEELYILVSPFLRDLTRGFQQANKSLEYILGGWCLIALTHDCGATTRSRLTTISHPRKSRASWGSSVCIRSRLWKTLLMGMAPRHKSPPLEGQCALPVRAIVLASLGFCPKSTSLADLVMTWSFNGPRGGT